MYTKIITQNFDAFHLNQEALSTKMLIAYRPPPLKERFESTMHTVHMKRFLLNYKQFYLSLIKTQFKLKKNGNRNWVVRSFRWLAISTGEKICQMTCMKVWFFDVGCIITWIQNSITKSCIPLPKWISTLHSDLFEYFLFQNVYTSTT